MVPEVRPAAKWLFIPIAGIVAGIVLAAFGFVQIFGGIFNEKQPLYTGAAITAEKGGTYSIYYEYHLAYRLNEDVEFSFAGSDGTVYQSRFSGGSVTYNIGSRSGERIGVVELPAGVYTVSCSAQDTTLDFVLDDGALMGKLGFGIAGLVCGILLFVFAVIGLAVMLVMRGSSRRKLQQDPYYKQ